MWPRRSLTQPIFLPAGSLSKRTEPSLPSGTSGLSGWSRWTSISPSMMRTASSCALEYQGESPSARMASMTYLRFWPTATLSYGFDLETIGETVVLRVVVDDPDAAFFVVFEGAENCVITTH